MRRAIFSAILTLMAVSSLGGNILIGPETPFFKLPDAKSEVIQVSATDMELESSESVEGVFTYAHLGDRPWLPIGLATRFNKVQAPDGSAAWVAEDIKFDKAKGPVPSCVPFSSRAPLLLLVYALFATGLFVGMRFGFGNLFIPGWKAAALAFWLLLSFRLCLSMTVIYLAGGIIIIPVDEKSYFQIARDIASLGPITEAWRYTLGNAVWQLPFIIAANAKDYMDIRVAISFFNCFATASGIIALTWFMVEKLSGSRVKALLAGGLLSILPFVSFPVELFSVRIFKNVMAIPDINPGSYRLYDIFNNIGFNGLSDTPSTFLCLACVALALIMRPKSLWQFAGIAGLYSFACLLRVNNAVIAPLIAYLLWRKLKEDGATLSRMSAAMGVCAGSFLLVFSPQLIANAMQLGSPLTFPYVLHPNNAGKGFLLYCLPRGIEYLIGCNFIPVCLLAAALPFVADSRKRAVLCLWGVPLLTFFCGYPEVGGSPTRFILPFYPAVFAAVVMAGFWEGLDWKKLLPLAMAVLASCALCAPCHRMTPTLPWDIENYAWGANAALALNIAVPLLCLGIALWLFRSSRQAGLFLLLFGALYFIGSQTLLFACLALLLCWTLASFALEILLHFKSQSSSSSTGQ